jgi:hypothetical protein
MFALAFATLWIHANHDYPPGEEPLSVLITRGRRRVANSLIDHLMEGTKLAGFCLQLETEGHRD